MAKQPLNEVLMFLVLRSDDLTSMHMLDISVPIAAPLKGELIAERLEQALLDLHNCLPGSPDSFMVYALNSPPQQWSVETTIKMVPR
jgi:hypothetical protein